MNIHLLDLKLKQKNLQNFNYGIIYGLEVGTVAFKIKYILNS